MNASSVGSIVHKFGGSSLADAECFRRVATIVAERPEARRLIVVSAMGGMTDNLLKAARLAAARDESYHAVLTSIALRHRTTISELVPGAKGEALTSAIERDLVDIADVLRAAALLRGHSRETLELVSGYGEVWSAQILAALLNARGTQAGWLDARDVLTVSRTETGAEVEWSASRERIAEWLDRHPPSPTLVITGFVASTADGVAATLGRNGSDFSASIFAATFSRS